MSPDGGTGERSDAGRDRIRALAAALGVGGEPAGRAYQDLFAALMRDPKATIPTLLEFLEDLRPVARDFPIAELRFLIAGAPISTANVLRGGLPEPLTVADLVSVLIFNELRVDCGFRSDLPGPERATAAERLRAFWLTRR